jgi:hypothetical protein
MYNTNKSLYDRSLEKTPEQLFINSLRKEYELSPAESQGILELAKSYLFGEVPKILGKQKFLCASKRAKHGRALKEQEKLEVELTLDGGIEDLDVLRSQGSKALRQLKKNVKNVHNESEYDLDKLIRQINSEDLRKRIKAIETLGNVGDELCLKELREKMKIMHDEYQALIVAIGKLKKRLI